MWLKLKGLTKRDQKQILMRILLKDRGSIYLFNIDLINHNKNKLVY
jgi:hypothetical protein